MVPSKVRCEFFRKCVEKKFDLKYKNESYFMEFQKFVQNEYNLVVNESSLVFTPYAELKDVVEQSRRVAEEGINENVEDSVPEKGM